MTFFTRARARGVSSLLPPMCPACIFTCRCLVTPVLSPIPWIWNRIHGSGCLQQCNTQNVWCGMFVLPQWSIKTASEMRERTVTTKWLCAASAQCKDKPWVHPTEQHTQTPSQPCQSAPPSGHPMATTPTNSESSSIQSSYPSKVVHLKPSPHWDPQHAGPHPCQNMPSTTIHPTAPRLPVGTMRQHHRQEVPNLQRLLWLFCRLNMPQYKFTA